MNSGGIEFRLASRLRWILFGGFVLVGCKFEHTIPTLEFPTAPPQAFQQFSAEEPDLSTPVSEASPSSAGFLELDPATALAICGRSLSWGDETVGMCIAPGGSSYFVWSQDGAVIEVPIDPLDTNQEGFRRAAEARASAIESVRTEVRSIFFEGIGFGASLIAVGPACATVLGCAVDIVALSVTGGLLAESGSSIFTSIDTFDTMLAQSGYFYCRMQGGSDLSCRETSGVSGDAIGEGNE